MVVTVDLVLVLLTWVMKFPSPPVLATPFPGLAAVAIRDCDVDEPPWLVCPLETTVAPIVFGRAGLIAWVLPPVVAMPLVFVDIPTVPSSCEEFFLITAEDGFLSPLYPKLVLEVLKTTFDPCSSFLMSPPEVGGLLFFIVDEEGVIIPYPEFIMLLVGEIINPPPILEVLCIVMEVLVSVPAFFVMLEAEENFLLMFESECPLVLRGRPIFDLIAPFVS